MPATDIRIKLAIDDSVAEKILIETLARFDDFEVLPIAATTRILATKMANTDFLIVCNEVLARNHGFQNTKSSGRADTFPIFVALYRSQLSATAEHLGRINGCILLDGNLELLPDVVRMAKGGYCVVPEIMNEAFIDFRMEQAWICELSLIECAMLNEVGLGRNEREIARRLSLYLATVRRLLTPLIKKLRISTLSEAQSFALRNREKLYERRRWLIRQEGSVNRIATR